jgi:DNA polymerase-1
MKNKLLLIDGNNMLNRAFYAVPMLTDSLGRPVNAIKGSINILLANIHEEKPTHLVAVFDAKGPTFRHKAYPEYKGNRPPKPEEFKPQIAAVQELFRLMGIPVMEMPGFEADDIIGSTAKEYARNGYEVCILSADRDMLQLVSGNITVKAPKHGGEHVYYTPDAVRKSYGIEPEQIIDLKALMGDASDNIKGVPKVGEKTAVQLIQQFGTVEGIIEHSGEIKKPSIRKTMEENKDLALFSKKLVSIYTKLIPRFDADSLKVKSLDTPEAKKKLAEYGINVNLSIY